MNDIDYGPAKSITRRIAIAGFILAFLGIVSVASPLFMGVGIAILIGILLALGGVSQIAFACAASSGSQRIMLCVIGAINLVCGVLILCHPLAGLRFMTVLLMVFFIVTGISEVVHALQLRAYRGWQATLVSGIVSLALGIVIWKMEPEYSNGVIGVIIGVRLFVYGVALAVLGIAARTMVSEEEQSGGPTPLA
jgi:uncharacterized membrane protein HdeD (DUF308 family)